MSVFQGRRKIVTEYKSEQLADLTILANVLNSTRMVHLMNKGEIDYLQRYAQGVQPILEKEKVVREEINNKLVINHADMVTRTIVGYFLGTPIEYVQNGDTTKKVQIDELNRYVAYENKSTTDKEIGDFQSICGTAYRIIFTDGEFADEVPFEEKALDPALTYVVYENTIAEKPILGVTYHDLYGDSGEVVGTKIFAYTSFGQYEITTKSYNGMVTSDSEVVFDEYNIGGVPIIEYPNNRWRIGDWELSMGLMDAINNLQSGRLDDIDQIVQSLLVFINADIDSDRYDEMREAGLILLKNTTGNKSEVKSVSNPLDQTGLAQFSDELESLLYAMLGIPERSTRSGGGGDTGQAVELRDGWADLEIVARNKELTYRKSEKQTLRIILKILNNKMAFDLSLMDIDIKFSRNKNNNLLVKAQSYSTLLATKTLSPADCLSIVDLVSDVNEYVERGAEFWGDEFGGKTATETIEAEATVVETEPIISEE